MCNLSDSIEQKGIEKALLRSIQNLMKNLKLSIEQAMTALGVPEADREKYAKMIKLQNK